VKTKLPVREAEQVLIDFPELRQSRLATFDSCPLAALFEIGGHEFSNRAQARGILFHRVASEILRTIKRTGEVMIDVAEGLEIMYEVAAQRGLPPEEVVHLPLAEQRILRMAVICFCHHNTFTPSGIIDVERRLYAKVSYPDRQTGNTVERVITGQPDAVIADPPEGALVPDWKTTRQAPPKYEGADENTDAGVSYMGYFQQRVYAKLVMDTYQAIQRVTLWENYVLPGEVREATVHREQLEHIDRELATLVELFDRALAGGSKSPLWQPSPGRHCSYCPKPTACPIEADVRVFASQNGGGITSDSAARRFGAEYVLAKATYKALHEALKGWVEIHGPIPVKSSKGRYQLRWKQNSTGTGRTFGAHVPEKSDRGPKDERLEAAFEEAKERDC
jgi:hypothetical protein